MSQENTVITQYINDFSWTLNLKNEAYLEIEELFSSHYEATEEQIITIIIPSLEGKSLKSMWMKFFNDNWFWNSKTNKWLLLIISHKEKKLRIIVWKWLKKKYPVVILRAIVENKLRGLVNIWDYERLLKIWLKITTDNDERKAMDSQNTSIKLILFFCGVGLLILPFVLFFFFMISTFLCVIYYEDIIIFFTILSWFLIFLYVLYRFIKDMKWNKNHTYIMLWIFVAVILFIFTRFLFLATNEKVPLNNPDKENRPEWCDLKKWSTWSINQDIYQESKNNYILNKSDDSSRSFWWWGSTDGDWYGD
jgi:uncharacterized membrane protein YgcG